ncbi:flagellar biosynthetic protein FliO [Peribacillus sp. NPDC097225]|uniref:flagellar biosynthetic protein FliO n=1 Tax=Peribacillus sp. NPDC097225 TaxID=3364400 RepID=UPI0037F202D0
MFALKKWLQVSLALVIVFCGAIQAHAQDQDDTVKNFFEPENSKTDKTDKSKESLSTNSQSTDEATNPEKVGITGWEFLRMILATIFVVVLLYIVLRFVGKKSKTYQKANSVENLGGTSLGANRSVQLVKVGGRILVVGVGENIQLLKEIDDPKEYEQLIEDYNGKIDQMIQPRDLVEKMKGKWLKKDENETNSFSSEFKNQLEKMSKSRKKLLKELDRKGRDKE